MGYIPPAAPLVSCSGWARVGPTIQANWSQSQVPEGSPSLASRAPLPSYLKGHRARRKISPGVEGSGCLRGSEHLTTPALMIHMSIVSRYMPLGAHMVHICQGMGTLAHMDMAIPEHT